MLYDFQRLILKHQKINFALSLTSVFSFNDAVDSDAPHALLLKYLNLVRVGNL